MSEEDYLKLVPVPKRFILDSECACEPGELIYCKMYISLPDLLGVYCLYHVCEKGKRHWDDVLARPYAVPFEDFVSVEPETKQQVRISARDIYNNLSRGYDFATAYRNYRKGCSKGVTKPSVAFTVIDSSVKGGGTMVVYKYANWLSEMGVDVSVYSNDKAPDWIDVKGRFYRIKNEIERYSAIKEPVIITYSVRELQDMLRCCSNSGKVIYHLCQGVEEHHFGHITYSSLMAEKPMFGFLHSLPVGRLAVSPHVRNYFRDNFKQETIDIFNGIDLELFRPRQARKIGKTINLLTSGDPRQIFKGKGDISRALNIVASVMPDVKFHLTIVNGGKLEHLHFATNVDRFTCDIKCDFSREQMRQVYYESDMYINSSWYEGFSMPALEAMACGVPLIQVDNKGLDEIAVNGKNCVMIGPNNPEKMAGAIQKVMEDDIFRTRIIENGIVSAERFSEANQYNMFVRAFERILCCDLDKLGAEAKRQKTVSVSSGPAEVMSDGPLFSILVPTYNQAHFLPEALDSIINQTYTKWEALVVNDGSTDNTAEVMKEYAEKDSRIRTFHKENGGAASALNEGLRNARGGWICWLSSDDYFEPNKLEVHLQAIGQNPDIKFFHTHYSIIDKTGRKRQGELDQNTSPAPLELQVLKFFQSNYFNGISICIWRGVFEELGLFNERSRYGQDFDMWLRISRRYPSMFIDSRTCVTRQYEEQITNMFPLRGIYDSARACVDFLNSHKFAELFPRLDLSRAKDAIFAIKSVFAILMNPSAFVNLVGVGAALLARMREWLCGGGCEDVRAAFRPHLAEVVKGIREMNLSKEITTAFEDMYANYDRPFSYSQFDALNEMARHVARLKETGRTKEALDLQEFLGDIRRFLDSKTIGDNSKESAVMEPKLSAANNLPIDAQGQIQQKKTNANLKIGMAVLAHERPEYLKICLDTLFKTKLYDYDVTFLLQDDGSKDLRVREILEQPWDSRYKIERYYTPKGGNCAGAAINKAIRRLMEIGDFDVIGWCDPDCLFHPEWLDKTMKICLWARENHTAHVLGPFTSFNSSDYIFHRILGSYESPFGNYVVKRQAGMLNYFYLKEDFLKFGYFPENQDDEYLMTQRLESMGVRNFCTETSYVEHIGQDSVLNQWRPTPVRAAVYGLNLAKSGWPGVLEERETLGYFRSVKQNASIALDCRSEMKLDILIPVAEKDIDVLGRVVKGLKENLRHPISRIIAIGPETNKVKFVSIAEGCEFIPEEGILPIRKEDIDYFVKGMDRSGWLFQQLLKWSGDQICTEENYLVMDADTILIRPQVFEVGGKFVLLHSDEHHQPYFDLYKRLFGSETKTALSFVSHQMLMNKGLIGQLKKELQSRHGANWLEVLFANIDGSQVSGMSEYELYGQWLLANHPESIERDYWFNVPLPRAELDRFKEFKNKLFDFCRSISFHEFQKPAAVQKTVPVFQGAGAHQAAGAVASVV